MRQRLKIHIGILPDGYCSVEIFAPDNTAVHKQDTDPGYELELMKPRDNEEEGILYDNLD